MDRARRLLARLDEIGYALEQAGGALALIGLGSSGVELERLDEYSDLDFFVVVAPGHKRRFVEDLGWLAAAGPIAYAFRNTADGYKLLFADGIFCELAIFEPDELRAVPFSRGRLVWRPPEVDEAIATPAASEPPRAAPAAEWLLGEALTNLYVGLGRCHRGEMLSAQRFIQHYAVDRIVDLAALVEAERPAPRDQFAGERRFERRFPGVAASLPLFVQGYARSRESAAAILGFLEAHFEVSPAMARAIRELCEV